MNQLKHPLQDYAQIGVDNLNGETWYVVAWPDRNVHPNPKGFLLATDPEYVGFYATKSEACEARDRLTERVRPIRRLMGRDVTWLVP